MAADAAPAPDRPRRRSLGLGTRIFLLIALVVALAIGSAVVFSYVVAERIARDTAGAELASTSQLQDTFRDQRYDQLLLSSYLFVQGDAYLSAYIAEAVSTNDSASILDLLSERQVDLGYDFAIVLDPQGRVLSRTDRPGVVGEDLSARPLVDMVLAEYEAFGVWRESDDLYYAVAIPIARGAQLIGFLVSGFALSDDTAAEVERVSGTEVAYLATADGPPQVVASSLDPGVEGRLVAALSDGGDPFRGMSAGGEAAQREVSLAGERWLARIAPLLDAGRQPVGAVVALAPLEAQLAPFRRIGRVLALTGLVALALALLLAFALARRTLKPVRQLVAATAAARGGDYDREIPVARGDEVGELADSFNALLSDLREKRDMEAYIADLSRTMPEPSQPSEPVVPKAASGGEATFLVADLRVGVAAASENPQVAFDRFSAELSRLAQTATARRGKLAGLAGHRVWVRFEGEARTFRAFACAGELMRTYVEAGRTAAAPVVAIASGEAAWGAAAYGEERRGTTLGRTAQRLETLMREASPGDVALSVEAEAELRATFSEAGVSVAEQRGVVSTQPLYVIEARTAAKMIGDQALPTLAASSPSTPSRAGGDTPVTFGSIGPGSVVGGRFEILAVIGAGGMGVVYKARDRELGDVVAVKMLRPDLAGDATHVTRLRDELRLARRITHPNVLRTFDLGEVGGIPFISMEYVRGVTLAQLLDHTDRLAYSAGISVGKQLCQGLAAAHEVGVLHRDIKPANLILMANGNLKLMDFGIARPIRRNEPGQTVEGWLVGTPKYLAPEQLRGEEPDARADIYACGVVLYEMFTGTAPFEGESYVELATKTLKEDPPPPKQRWAEMPAELERIIMRCLAKDPKQRYPSAEALLADLSRLKA